MDVESLEGKVGNGTFFTRADGSLLYRGTLPPSALNTTEGVGEPLVVMSEETYASLLKSQSTTPCVGYVLIPLDQIPSFPLKIDFCWRHSDDSGDVHAKEETLFLDTRLIFPVPFEDCVMVVYRSISRALEREPLY